MKKHARENSASGLSFPYGRRPRPSDSQSKQYRAVRKPRSPPTTPIQKSPNCSAVFLQELGRQRKEIRMDWDRLSLKINQQACTTLDRTQIKSFKHHWKLIRICSRATLSVQNEYAPLSNGSSTDISRQNRGENRLHERHTKLYILNSFHDLSQLLTYHNYDVHLAKIIFAANENEQLIAIHQWGFSHYPCMVLKASLGLRELARARSRNLFDNPCTLPFTLPVLN